MIDKEIQVKERWMILSKCLQLFRKYKQLYSRKIGRQCFAKESLSH
jgi:hypothetical protein